MVSIGLAVLLTGCVISGYVATKTDTEDPVIKQ